MALLNVEHARNWKNLERNAHLHCYDPNTSPSTPVTRHAKQAKRFRFFRLLVQEWRLRNPRPTLPTPIIIPRPHLQFFPPKSRYPQHPELLLPASRDYYDFLFPPFENYLPGNPVNDEGRLNRIDMVQAILLELEPAFIMATKLLHVDCYVEKVHNALYGRLEPLIA